MPRIVILAALGIAAAPAIASSPDAWAAERRAAHAACIAASGLAAPTVTPPAAFDDRLPLDALLLTGRIRERRGLGARASMLCLYDRRSKRARVVEATGWPAAR